jgi:hypothetical protein
MEVKPMTDSTQCTDKTCMGEAVYALWMGEQFSRVADAHPSYSYDDGDLHPHVCEDCLPRYRDLHSDKGEFIRPEEKLVADGGREDDTNRSVIWEYGPIEQQHIRDANRADDRPDDLTFDVEGGEVIATGSEQSIRWLYDYLHDLKRAWRNEGEQWDADAAEEMAKSLYEQFDGNLPEQQRNKKAMTDGGHCSSGIERTECWNCGFQRPTFEACPECGCYGGGPR